MTPIKLLSSQRPNKDLVFLDVADTIAQLGTCDRKQVGAVIIRDGRCVSWGYNGAPPGQPHCDENNHGNPEYDRTATNQASEAIVSGLHEAGITVGCRNATHAEANALAFAARQGISTDGATLFVTVSPCEVCARLCIAAGIVRVVWEEEYRDRSGIQILERAGLVFATGR